MKAGGRLFLAGSTDQFHWTEDAFPPLDFCVQTLKRDGLRIHPFDEHPDGDSSLRNRGLNAEVWRQWVASVITHSELLSQVPASPADGRTDPRFLAEVAEFLRRPSSACPGSDGLRGRLDEMWAEYEPTADAWKRAITGPEGVRRMGRPADQRRRWQALQPFHSRVATIQVFLVSYPAPVVMASSPTACLIAPDRNPAAYTQQVVAAAKLLAAAA
jgi:hypothetical protein